MERNEIQSEFGARLKELRLQRGVSQERLGQVAGLDRTYISSAESGRRNVTLGSIYKLATALEVEPRDLLPPYSATQST